MRADAAPADPAPRAPPPCRRRCNYAVIWPTHHACPSRFGSHSLGWWARCLFLAAGAAIVAATWGENFGGSAKKEAKEGEKEEGNSAGALVGEAIGEMKKDKKILLVGAVQVTRCHHYRRICLLPHHHRHHHQLTSCTSLHHRRSSRAQCTSSYCSGRRR